MKQFEYSNSIRVVDWNLGFDSVLELKYAISIHSEYEFLHNKVSIYYDPATKKLLKESRGNARRYTPDFLIRHRAMREAFWVEVKPEGFNDGQSLFLKQKLAEEFIFSKQLDWKFRIVYGNEIHLNTDQLIQFNECCSALFSGKKISAAINPFRYRQSLSRERFVMWGTNRETNNWME